MRQFVNVEFTRGGRSYAYHNDREPVDAGDRVVVSTSRGAQVVTVLSVSFEEPPFATKPIVGKER